MKAILENIKNHKHSILLNQALAPGHESFKTEYKSLSMIGLDYDLGKFTDSNEIKTELYK